MAILSILRAVYTITTRKITVDFERKLSIPQPAKCLDSEERKPGQSELEFSCVCPSLDVVGALG